MVLFYRRSGHRPRKPALLLASLATVETDLSDRAAVVIKDRRGNSPVLQFEPSAVGAASRAC